MVTLIAFVIMFGLVVFVHEFGHFIVSKLAGVKVDEFGFGYPPRLFSLGTWRGTEYTINAIPVGGFVKVGEDDPSRPDSLASQGRGVRALVFASGSFMNLLLAVACYALVFMFGQQYWIGRVVIDVVATDSPAAVAGLRVGDTILEIDGVPVYNSWELQQHTNTSVGREVLLAIERDGERLTVSLVPRVRPPAGQGPMGIGINMKDVQAVTLRYPIWQAIPAGLRRTGETLGMVVTGFVGMIRGTVPPDVTGPIGLFQVTGEVAKSGWVNLLDLMALVNVNLFLINLLPLPPFDGGKLFLIGLELVRGGRRFEPQKEGLVQFIGMIILLGLMLLISYKDLLRLISGQPILP